jgi:Eukaryotic initiation factor 4E
MVSTEASPFTCCKKSSLKTPESNSSPNYIQFFPFPFQSSHAPSLPALPTSSHISQHLPIPRSSEFSSSLLNRFIMADVEPAVPPTEAMDKLSVDGQSAAAPAASTNETPSTVQAQEPLTVFHDPKNFNVKHPLMNAWTLWFTKTPSATGPKESWADLLKEVITFDSVEEFWGYHTPYPLYLSQKHGF